MAINKVIFDNNTLIDITDTTATADDVAEGKEFYLANGVKAMGTSTGGNIDNTTITKNSSNQMQTVGVIDQNTGNADKFWSGTLAEYNAIENKDANTFYNITDDTAEYITKNDIATTDEAGVVKASDDYKFEVSSSGSPRCQEMDYTEYQSISTRAFIGKGTLENVLRERIPTKEKVEIDFTVEETADDYAYQYSLTDASINLLSQKVINDDLDFEVVLNPLTDYEDFDKKLIEPFEIKKRITTRTQGGKNYKDLYMQIFYYYENPLVGMLSSRWLEYTFTYNISDMTYPDIDEQFDMEVITDTNWVHRIANTKFSTEFTDMSGAMSVATKTASQYNSLNNGAFIGKGTLNNVLNDRFANLKLSKLTQAQYNALSTKDANTMYIIVG